MSPDVINKKLLSMTTYLNDLMAHKDISFDEFMQRHYEIERLLELLVMTASDIIFHLISAKEEPVPASYRAAFLRAGEMGIIGEELSKNLALGAGLRNILVHEYEEIDYSLVHKSIHTAVRDFTAFIKELS
ncbi:MAG: hypothetical protein A2077_02910 [Nitrospirae bacterium GWC2_46_6]|nr:MAG: hypothetical protein A2077_02910 [Nitrospirae bacterium GWC2_46_6]OGW21704.1 MAG: hypothetical protein A2Z82_03640 [Nitrospirae bacterium GWA2_46_11]OGW23622.1 MAG: hypothetical protein A2X55_03305 [Nitrospirae bacterium GWB2_47_37]HAK88117.1 DUF86 domain-containing protein [Nitrospiraceae bacterium]HCL82193.1 DUF86 domain-containing protein [Nitrospiraceae bacterium]